MNKSNLRNLRHTSIESFEFIFYMDKVNKKIKCKL